MTDVCVGQIMIMGLPDYYRICKTTSILRVSTDTVVIVGFDLFCGDIFEDVIPADDRVTLLTPFVETKRVSYILPDHRCAFFYDWPGEMVPVRCDLGLFDSTGYGYSPNRMGRVWTFHTGQKLLVDQFIRED